MITLKVGNYNTRQVMALRGILEKTNVDLCDRMGSEYCELCKVRPVCKDIARALSHLDEVISEDHD